MSSIVDPKKFKAHLSKMKGALDDSSSNCYVLLLVSELALRGVIYSGSFHEEELVLESVTATAGKELLNGATLAVGAWSLAGMIAESCASARERLSTSKEVASRYESTQTRCNQVHDHRFSCLLKLAFSTDNARTSFLTIAFAHYLYAASTFNPHVPVLWKRALDVAISLSSTKDTYETYHTPYAQSPLEHLIRIASLKGNVPRVQELSLHLVESLLAPEDNCPTIQVFYSDYKTETRWNKIQQAQTLLHSLPHVTNLLCTILRLRVWVEHETLVVSSLVQDRITAIQNRGISNTKATFTVNEIESQVQRELWTNSSSSESNEIGSSKGGTTTNAVVDNDAINMAAVALRNASLYFFDTDSTEHVLDDMRNAVYVLLAQHMKRLTDVAQAFAVLKGRDLWEHVASFAVPILERIHADHISEMSLSARELVECAAHGVLITLWMTRSSSTTPSGCGEEENAADIDDPYATVSLKQIGLAVSLLDNCQTLRKAEQKNFRRKEKEHVSTSSEERNILQDIIETNECALTAGNCRLGLAKIRSSINGSGVTDFQNVASREAPSDRANSRLAGIQFGTMFLQFLWAWSGLHQEPWPFCTISQARSIIRNARDLLTESNKTWGRPISMLERRMLDIGEADAKASEFVPEATSLYNRILNDIESEPDNDLSVNVLLKAHCLLGLSRIALAGRCIGNEVQSDGLEVAEQFARSALQSLQSLAATMSGTASTFFTRVYPNSFLTFVIFHVCLARQLVAESLVRSLQPLDAQSFLEDAVRDAPLDYNAAFSLGAFRLRMAFYSNDSSFNCASGRKAAQTQLLKSAKLDTTKADPFALLGLWYEVHNDTKRAIGCHSKALLIDATHPVAGRGILRLLPSFDESRHYYEAAANVTSPVNGWAWRAMGNAKAEADEGDEMAILCLQQALRCRDIENRVNESLGIFYSKPLDNTAGDYTKHQSMDEMYWECGSTWADLAGHYRRLGKYSASLRAYDSAFEATGGNLPPNVLCACAQVELELGLPDEAIAKFEKVLTLKDDCSFHFIAAYGHGMGMLVLARRDVEEGKFGMALAHLQSGIQGMFDFLVQSNEDGSMTSPFGCCLKLVGDLHTFGAALPPSVFKVSDTDVAADITGMEAQIMFVRKGELAYISAFSEGKDDVVRMDLCTKQSGFATGAACNVGVNLLWQARLVCASLGEGAGGGTNSSMIRMPKYNQRVRDLLHRSVEYFIKAIRFDGSSSSAWCGVGCALVALDPLLAQHAFCRALQLDKSSPDAWANLGLLYCEYGLCDASAEAIDTLTQVADTPLIWIVRGLLLEKKAAAANNNSAREELFSRAADAYRAALQITRHPTALLGLSLTSRRLGLSGTKSAQQNNEYIAAANKLAQLESFTSMSIYLHSTGGQNACAQLLGGVMTLEEGLNRLRANVIDPSDELLHRGSETISNSRKRLSEMQSKTIESGSHSRLQTLNEIYYDEKVEIKGEGGTGCSAVDLVVACDAAQMATMSASQNEKAGMKFGGTPLGVTLPTAKRNVRLEPDRGDLWLVFATELAKRATSSKSSSKQSFRIVYAAAKKAKELLHSKVINTPLLHPRKLPQNEQQDGTTLRGTLIHSSIVPESIDAALLSQAMALCSWILDLNDTMGSDFFTSKMDLQRSLLLDPETSWHEKN